MININYRDPRPIYEQVKDEMRRLILTGALPPGSKISSVREMAATTAINPSTIQRAYRELEQEGYIGSVIGKGSFVCSNDEVAQLMRRDLMAEFDKLIKRMHDAGITDSDIIAHLEGGQKK